MASLDVTSRAYEPAVLARFVLEVSKALTVVAGELLVLLPGTAASAEARGLLDGDVVWPAEDRERLRVSSLAMQGAPQPGTPGPAAVVLVGLTPSDGADDASLRDARAWMRAGSVAVVAKAIVDHNHRIGADPRMRERQRVAYQQAYQQQQQRQYQHQRGGYPGGGGFQHPHQQ